MDLEKANEDGGAESPEWYMLYSAKKSYNMTSLTPQDWHDFFEKIMTDDETWDLYYKYFFF